MYKIGQEEIDAVAAVIRSKQLFRYRGGEQGQVDQAEEKLQKILGASHAISVTSGTGALVCGLVGMGIGPGDEVIVPAYTWLASPGAVLSAGAIPVLAEADESLTLDPENFERKISPRTKAVMPVHIAGHPCDMDKIKAIADKHGVKIIEDACQSVGGSYKGQRLTTIGDCGAFSFNQYKNISCGEGGALMTSDRKIYERALIYHDMGCSFRVHADKLSEPCFLGNTFRMNEILGAVLNVQLDRLDDILAGLRERRNLMLDIVRGHGLDPAMRITPSADTAGDCGCNASFIFESIELRKLVAERLSEIDSGCKMDSPIDSGLHVYKNWSVLLEQKGGHHPDINPFLHPANRDCRLKIDSDCCPATLEILARTGTIGIDLEMSNDDCARRAENLCRAMAEVTGAKIA